MFFYVICYFFVNFFSVIDRILVMSFRVYLWFFSFSNKGIKWSEVYSWNGDFNKIFVVKGVFIFYEERYVFVFFEVFL